MKQNKGIRAVSAAVLTALISLGALPAQGADEYPWSGNFDSDRTLSFELWEDARSQATHINRILDHKTVGKNGIQPSRLCLSITVGPCATALNGTKDGFEGTFVAPVCEKNSDENCIEWISIHEDQEPATKATLLRNIEGGTTPKLAKYGLPKGGTTSLWSQEGKTNAGGTDTYAATLRMGVNFDPRPNLPHANFTIGSYNLQVKPYQETQGDYTPHSCSEHDYLGVTVTGCGGLPEECAWSGVGVCGKEVGFASNTRVSVSFRIDATTSGWFAGRVQDPNISIKRINSKQLRVQISGQPSQVPVARGHMPTSRAPAALKAEYSRGCPEFRTTGRCWSGIFAASTGAMSYIDGFRKEFKDTATFQRQVWSVRTVQTGSLGQCAAGDSRVIGIVSTNAMGYQAEPPKFTRGFLNYQVSGMHYLPGGEELALGNYDLVVRSDFARCLYGFGQAPLSANVSVVNNKGTKVFATTTVGEKNGWLKLSAKGFTFSKKTIKVKITKAKPKKKKKG
jgi:hypothetical protein